MGFIKKGPPSAWQDDDADTNNNGHLNVRSTPIYQHPVFEPKKLAQEPVESYSKEKSEPMEYERKIVDRILQPSGISLKPSANQLSAFVTKLKTLNRGKVYQIITEKLSEGICSSNQGKVLAKCLYLIIELLEKKVPEAQEFFAQEEVTELFSDVENCSENKKIRLLCKDVYKHYNASPNKNKKTAPSEMIDVPHSDRNPQNICDIFDIGFGNPIVENKSVAIDVFRELGTKEESKPEEKSKGFSFIKSTKKIEEPSKKKGFNFIKSSTSKAAPKDVFSTLNDVTAGKNKEHENFGTFKKSKEFNFIKGKKTAEKNFGRENEGSLNELNDIFNSTGSHLNNSQYNENLIHVPRQVNIEALKNDYLENFQEGTTGSGTYNLNFMNYGQIPNTHTFNPPVYIPQPQPKTSKNSSKIKDSFDFVNDMLKKSKKQ